MGVRHESGACLTCWEWCPRMWCSGLLLLAGGIPEDGPKELPEKLLAPTSLPGGVSTELSRKPLLFTSWAPFISGLMV